MVQAIHAYYDDDDYYKDEEVNNSMTRVYYYGKNLYCAVTINSESAEDRGRVTVRITVVCWIRTNDAWFYYKYQLCLLYRMCDRNGWEMNKSYGQNSN